MSKGHKLTDKQKAFCQEYIIDFNAAQSAIRAGYSKDTAKQIGARLLSNVYLQGEVNKQLDERTQRVEVKQDRIVYELAKLAFADLGNYVSVDSSGVTVKDLDDLDTSLLQEASQSVNKEGVNVKIKMHDKLKALELLGKHLAMYTDKTETHGTIVYDADPVEKDI